MQRDVGLLSERDRGRAHRLKCRLHLHDGGLCPVHLQAGQDTTAPYSVSWTVPASGPAHDGTSERRPEAAVAAPI